MTNTRGFSRYRAAGAVLVLFAATAAAQPLYELELPPIGRAASPSMTGPGELLPEVLPVQVDLDLLRSAPGLLAFPIPDGEPLWAVRTHFEDRGEGNVLWRGRVAGGPLFDSVLLTLQDGHLVGMFGAADGPQSRLMAAGRRGRVFESRPVAGLRHFHPETDPVLKPQTDGPVAVASPAMTGADTDRSNPYVIDLLVFYTRGVESVGSVFGVTVTAAAQIQSYIDSANLVFANNALNLTVRAVHVARLPEPVLSKVEQNDAPGSSGWLNATAWDVGVGNLRLRHRADATMLFLGALLTTGAEAERVDSNGFEHARYCGAAFGAWKSTESPADMAARAIAYVNASCMSVYDFSHELGHLIGLNHDPPSTINTDPLYSYAFGHVDTVNARKTVMSYGIQTVAPYLSTVRVAPNGWTLGVAGQRENEEALLRTRAAAARYDSLIRPRQPHPTDLAAVERPAAVDLTWTDNSRENGFVVRYRAEGADGWTAYGDTYGGTTGPGAESVTVTGLPLGAVYEFRVHAVLGTVPSKASNKVRVGPLGRPVPKPSSLTASNPRISRNKGGKVDLSWADNSDNETEYCIRYRQLGDSWRELETLPANTTARTVVGLTPGKHYRFQIEAWNLYGKGRSNTVTVSLPAAD